MNTEKQRANRIRRLAARHGFRLMKSRSRTPEHREYGGWMMVDANSNTVEFGDRPHAFSLSLDEIEVYLLD